MKNAWPPLNRFKLILLNKATLKVLHLVSQNSSVLFWSNTFKSVRGSTLHTLSIMNFNYILNYLSSTSLTTTGCPEIGSPELTSVTDIMTWQKSVSEWSYSILNLCTNIDTDYNSSSLVKQYIIKKSYGLSKYHYSSINKKLMLCNLHFKQLPCLFLICQWK